MVGDAVSFGGAFSSVGGVAPRGVGEGPPRGVEVGPPEGNLVEESRI